MLWVTKTTVFLSEFQILISSYLIVSRVISSSAPNGSSISNREGPKASARARATLCCIPPES